MKTTKQDKVGIALFLLPGVTLFLAFFIFPVIYVAGVSLTEWTGFTKASFVGIDNYIKIFKDPVFNRSIINNIVWALVAGFIQVPIAALVAILLSFKPKGWKIFRTVYFFPQVISGIALATLWAAIFNAEYGLLNGILELVGLSGLTRNWLGTLESAFPSVLLYWVLYIGYFMVIIFADVQGISEEYYEAAEIDGASRFMQSLYITLPLAKGSIVTCMTLAMINGIRQFEQVYMLTNGGPGNRTSVMVLYLYKEMQAFSYGTSSAAAVVLIFVGSLIILGLNKTLGKETH